MNYTITQAADAVGKGRSTIHRAIKEGRLSAHRGDGGTYYVDASELARVFPMASQESPKRDVVVHHNTPSGTEAATLALKVTMLEVALEREREAVAREREVADRERDVSDDLRKRLDRAEERVLALTAQPAPPPTSEPPAMVEELRRRLEESEAHIRALVTAAPPPAPQAAQEQLGQALVGVTPTGTLKGLLGRLLGR